MTIKEVEQELGIPRASIRFYEKECLIELSKTIQKAGVDIAEFDENFYWEEMNREEERGSRFMDIAKDIGQYQKSVFLEQFGIAIAVAIIVVTLLNH